MKLYIFRFLKLNFGLFLYALGIIITMKGNIGYAPWEVLHSGLSHTLGISIGLINTLVGSIIVIIVCLMGEKIGIGTLFNMFMIGTFMDFILFLNIIPFANNLWIGTSFLLLGLFIISLGTYFYIISAFGAGPRDSLMVAMKRKTHLPIGLCRGFLETSVVIVGWSLGGLVGIGTVISAFTIGFFVQITFKLLKFDPTQIEHESIATFYHTLKNFTKK